MVADYEAGIVGQLGGSTFQVREVVLNVILELLKGRRETFAECLTDLGVSIIDREMAEQMAFEILNGVQADKVDPNGVMEVFEVYPETEITRISSPGDNISFAGIQIRIQSGYEFGWKLGTEGFNGGEICEQLQSYLDEYCFRFNRRRSPDQLFSRLARAVAVSALSD